MLFGFQHFSQVPAAKRCTSGTGLRGMKERILYASPAASSVSRAGVASWLSDVPEEIWEQFFSNPSEILEPSDNVRKPSSTNRKVYRSSDFVSRSR